MMRRSFFSWACLVLIIGTSLVQFAIADEESDRMAEMFNGQQFGRGKEKKAPAVKSDLPYIRCGTCEAIVKESLRMVERLRSEVTAVKRLSEADMLDNLETMCDPDTDGGEWISFYDLQEEGDQLKLVNMEGPGECETECRTIARACTEVLEDADLVDISQALWSGAKRSALSQLLCRDQTNACRKKAPPLSKSRPHGPPFKRIKEEDLSIRATMRKMKASGMGGTLFNRDEIMENFDKFRSGDDSLPNLMGQEDGLDGDILGGPMATDEL